MVVLVDTSLLLSVRSKYHSVNISTNLYVISQPWLYTLAWCAGAQSVTTNSVHILSSINKPLFLMVSRFLTGPTRFEALSHFGKM